VQLRLFAPILPFVTEEVWSWWQDGSVHTTDWPALEELPDEGDPAVLALAGQVLSAMRKVKSDNKVSMRARLAHTVVKAPQEQIDVIRAAVPDLAAAGGLDTAMRLETASTFEVIADLAG
jgi:valyl-tRNA synthetase